MKATHRVHPNQAAPPLYMALELSKSEWDLAFAIGRTQPPRRRSIDARDLQQRQDEIRTTKHADTMNADKSPNSMKIDHWV